MRADANRVETLETGLGGRDRLDFGIVRRPAFKSGPPTSFEFNPRSSRVQPDRPRLLTTPVNELAG